MHQPLTRVLVREAELLRARDACDADPHAAVERLHEERIAHRVADLLQVEVGVVALGHGHEAGVVDRQAMRDQPGVRTLIPSRSIAQ